MSAFFESINQIIRHCSTPDIPNEENDEELEFHKDRRKDDSKIYNNNDAATQDAQLRQTTSPIGLSRGSRRASPTSSGKKRISTSNINDCATKGTPTTATTSTTGNRTKVSSSRIENEEDGGNLLSRVLTSRTSSIFRKGKNKDNNNVSSSPSQMLDDDHDSVSRSRVSPRLPPASAALELYENSSRMLQSQFDENDDVEDQRYSSGSGTFLTLLEKAADVLDCSPCKPYEKISSGGNRRRSEGDEHVYNITSKSRAPPLHNLQRNLTNQETVFRAALARAHGAGEKPDDRVTVAPINKLIVTDATILESISELTMRSSHGEAIAMIGDERRMAYYAVGKHDGHSKNGNRRCYFTGKLILAPAPFYAGSVQQGLRTLVVFCLPSSIGLPKSSSTKTEVNDIQEQARLLLLEVEKQKATSRSRSNFSDSESCAGFSASYDDESILEETTLDDPMAILADLPEPSNELLKAMEDRFPEQYATLPIQVRTPHCWRLYIKFCFFSGLPIAEGEPHYRVKDKVNDYGDEIIMSHDVLETAIGEQSADILRLPNRKTFRYLQKHYTLQSSKLSKNIFDRRSWEIVLPEC